MNICSDVNDRGWGEESKTEPSVAKAQNYRKKKHILGGRVTGHTFLMGGTIEV